MSNIIFYAASELNIPKEKIGGAETGAKRTYTLLLETGYNVTYVPKATTFYGKWHFIKEFINTYFKLKKLFKNNRGSIFYITAFYKRQSSIELKLIRLAKKYSLKIIYEPKNGSFVNVYNLSSVNYKKRIIKTLNLSNVVFCQGTEYVDFVLKHSSSKPVYIPNYVKNFTLPTYLDYDKNTYKICFFGRITSSKNILLILEIVNLIKRDNKGVVCKIIGGSSDTYKNQLLEYINNNKLEDNVIIYDRMSLEDIKRELFGFDYFIFPSAEKEEGHSNSLTEAMSFGLVPIVSNAGFNNSVVGNDIFVINELNAIKYKEKIYSLHNELPKFKRFVIERIDKNFRSEIVLNRQLDSIKQLIEK